MDPIMMIGLFFGGAVVFMVLFVVVMSLVYKGKSKPNSDMPDQGNKAADAMNTINNSNNF
ncbi:hypothetical protein [uncultured Maricaulis sp.]|uniref:hypothetical protein n=1 Tax=uncultured Maricaulis sp. TaxID=174710 RepID=UPI0026247741|nr:hypothetical protein [uncultured Maricaulis sp.]